MNMKNVNGLANAMRLVESACEKGEITIIGEGGMPTPVELYKKCVAFINRQYGVDILNLVLKEQKPCECNGSCTTVIVDTEADEDKIIVVALGEVEDIVDMIICDNMGYLNEGLIEDIVKEVKSYYEGIDGNIPEDYDTDYAVEGVYEALADCIDLEDFDEDYISNIVSKIVEEIDEKCISVE
jgi:hypothetical protein